MNIARIVRTAFALRFAHRIRSSHYAARFAHCAYLNILVFLDSPQYLARYPHKDFLPPYQLLPQAVRDVTNSGADVVGSPGSGGHRGIGDRLGYYAG